LGCTVLTRGSRPLRTPRLIAHGVSLRLPVSHDPILLESQISLLVYLIIQPFEVVLRETVVFQELSNLVVNVFVDVLLVAVLDLELVHKHAFQLLTPLDVQQFLPSRVAHF